MVKTRAKDPEHGEECHLSGIEWSLVGDKLSVPKWMGIFFRRASAREDYLFCHHLELPFSMCVLWREGMSAGIEDFLNLRGPEVVDRAFVCGNVQLPRTSCGVWSLCMVGRPRKSLSPRRWVCTYSVH